ncbi:UDP-glucose 6-dehydrogenase [Candidatus Peregrinibacteria bacterium CG10_big_fil_rev_8_21_14_0_10_49_16]|nr:MAG: UDP-glucose 6-dehydrogenase [Candidatus Peregrinibacteria bacterium CG22_combo_CG10-13_8_21_14_all_49_11]PIR51692.1 MAG: UDP-glucose 6-dehydrogenase [Candidatus Peregrinibacteria bacterium CG10_big_fil_rev_8_21_14_0_10_49_16]
MQIAIIGTGYVGLTTAVCFAEFGHQVVGMDIDEKKITMIKSGKSPIYEPGLEEILQRNLASGRLIFTTNLAEAIDESSVVFSAVGTPPNEDFSADLRIVYHVCEDVARLANHNLVFVNKSTVPIGTGSECEARMAAILQERGLPYHIPVISNPEFLREGCAVSDTLKPDRVLVGINNNPIAKDLMEEIYRPVTRTENPIIFMNRESAEIVKYASNAFLATKISFVNMLSELCEEKGANIRDVAKGMGLDHRIGPRFLHAGIGYGGSCFPKDVKALIALSRHTGIPMPIVEATHEINERQRQRFFQKLLNALPEHATVAVWGLSFKPKTDDMRDAPSCDLIPLLLEAGHTIRVFDPVAIENAKARFGERIQYGTSALDTATGADAVIVLTEWDVFRGINTQELRHVMRGTHLFDGRNIYEPKDIQKTGLTYHGIGISEDHCYTTPAFPHSHERIPESAIQTN